MTFIYWGGSFTGKNHLIKYAKVNNKSIAKLNPYRYIKYTTNVHIFDYPWYDYTLRTDVYHKRKDESDIRITTNITNKVEFIYTCGQPPTTNYINPEYQTKQYVEEVYFNDEELKKYSSLKYTNTTTYYEIFARGKHRDNLFEELLEKIDITKCSDTPDILLPNRRPPKEYSRQCINIVPYKENIPHSVICKLNNFGGFVNSKYGRDVYSAYNNDRELVFKWLDKYVFKGKEIEKKLIKDNIEYKLFNLDKDNYKDIFGWENELPRNMTDPTVCTKFGRDEENERHQHLIEIADNYINDRKITDLRL